MTGRPSPPITVTIPGRGEAPAELLAVGPPPLRLPRRPASPWWTGLAAVAVLVAGVVTVATDDPPPAPRPLPVVAADVGVSAATAGLVGGQDRELVTRFSLNVLVEGVGGPGDSASPSEEAVVTLVDVTARGFEVVLGGVVLPLELPPAGRDGTGFGFDAQAVVVDCSVDAQAPRRLHLGVQRGAGPVVPVPVDTGADVVRALDRLVSRTCRRPRG